MGNCVRKERSSSDISAQFGKQSYPPHHPMQAGPSQMPAHGQFVLQGNQPFARAGNTSMASMGSTHHMTPQDLTSRHFMPGINNQSIINSSAPANGTPNSGRRMQHHASVSSQNSNMMQFNQRASGKKVSQNSQSTPNQKDAEALLIALYPYDSRAEGDLSFQKGDAMVLLDDSNQDWWYVKHMSGERGYVPRNFVAPTQSAESEEWYSGKIPRNQAERLVEQSNLPRGTFLVREREGDNDQYALTIRDEDEQGRTTVKHYKIKRLDNGGFYITTRRTFSTLRSLVEYYSEVSDGLCHKLVFPAPRVAPLRPDLSHSTAKNWEIPREELELRDRLGTGNFGEVWYGLWRGCVEVAIKSMKHNAMSKKAFLDEAEIMKKCYHPNLVRLFAVCTISEPFYIITEYMTNGSLLSYLRGGEGSSLPQVALIEFCAMIANGMAYLEERKMVHRDLAARNVLVGQKISGVPQVKVADFGLARVLMDEEIYEAQTGAKFPIKWTAPEAALNGNFTVKSDVWSYGILLYEIITRGQTPYPGMANREVIEQVQLGYRMPQPLDSPQPVYECMLNCWEKIPERRPTFEYLYSYFNDFYVNAQPNYQAQSENNL